MKDPELVRDEELSLRGVELLTKRAGIKRINLICTYVP
jgi:hypothetical protein